MFSFFAKQQFISPQGSVEPSLRSGFYIDILHIYGATCSIRCLGHDINHFVCFIVNDNSTSNVGPPPCLSLI